MALLLSLRNGVILLSLKAHTKSLQLLARRAVTAEQKSLSGSLTLVLCSSINSAAFFSGIDVKEPIVLRISIIVAIIKGTKTENKTCSLCACDN